MATQLKNQEMYVPRPKFLELLSLVGANEKFFTFKQVIDYLKNYIFQRKLYDPHNPRLVHCESDELGTVFGVKEFTTNDVMQLVRKNVTVVDDFSPKAETSSCMLILPEECKRKCADSLDEVDASYDSDRSKRFCVNEASTSTPRPPSPMILALPGTPRYCSSSETELSVQGYETALICDTTDDELVSFEEEFTIEYDIDSGSSSDSIVSDTDSDIHDIAMHALLFCRDDSDKDFWADDSLDELSDSSDPELSEADKWKCDKCGSYNKPTTRYCQLCWEQRIGWLPEWHIRHPPQRHRLKKCKSSEQSEPSDQCSQSSQLSSQPSSQESLPSTTEQKPSASQIDSLLGVCMTCLQRPKNATITHGKTGHQVCCYTCARRLQDKRQPCPVCRRTIQKVIKNFIL